MQKNNIGIVAISLTVLFLLSGCATSSSVKIVDGKWDVIERSGTAEDVQYAWLAMPIKGEKKVFSPEVKKIYWFSIFRPLTFMISTDLYAKWYAPDGTIYSEYCFKTFGGSSQYAATSIDIQGTEAAQLLGRWKVQVYFDKVLIDEEEFHIKEKEARVKKVDLGGIDE